MRDQDQQHDRKARPRAVHTCARVDSGEPVQPEDDESSDRNPMLVVLRPKLRERDSRWKEPADPFPLIPVDDVHPEAMDEPKRLQGSKRDQSPTDDPLDRHSWLFI